MILFELIKTIVCKILLERVTDVAKRKAQFNAVEKYSRTPHKNVQESEFSAEFTHGEDDKLKGANRNSNKGREGRAHERTP